MTPKQHIPFSKPLLLGTEEACIHHVLSNKYFAGNGPIARRCEQLIERYTGSQRSLLTPSCTHALELAALLCQLTAGDEVIVPSFAFSSTANAFVSAGAVPVFVDVCPSDMNIDTQMLEHALSPRTKAIVALHYGGMACKMETLTSFAERHQLYLIEDAAQALGASYQGKALGSFGILSTLSFHETKNVHCGEGGALLINNPQMLQTAFPVRDKGTNRRDFLAGKVPAYQWTSKGSSYLISELNAAFLHAQLQQLEKVNTHRRQLWNRYWQQLQTLEENGYVQLPHPLPKARHNGHLFFLLCQSPKERERLTIHLKKHGISAYFHYTPLHLSPAGQQYGRTPAPLPVSEHKSKCLLRLPLYFDLTFEQVDYVCQVLKSAFGEH